MRRTIKSGVLILVVCSVVLALLPISLVHALKLSDKELRFLRDKRTITFVSQTRYPPFEFVDKNGQHEGMMLDVVRWLAVEIGFQPVFTDCTFLEAQQAVLSGKADVLTSLFYSDKRKEQFAFTLTLFRVPASIFVKSNRTDIKDLNDLNGKVIAMQKGDYAKEFLEAHHIRFQLLDTKDFAEATDMVIAGKADAVVGDEQIVLYHIFSDRLTDKIKKVGEPLYIGKNCMAAAKKNSLLVGILNKGIERARATGVLDKINTKWLGVSLEPKESWLVRHISWVASAAGGILLLSLWVWAWNLRLRNTVRKRTREIRLSELALRESEARYRDLFENANDLIYTHDLDGNYTSVNESAKRILGYSPGEFLKLNFCDIVDPDDLAVCQENLRKKVENGEERTGPYEILVRTKKGKPLWFEVTSRLIRKGGEPVGVHGIGRDITDRKLAEEARRESEEKYRLVVENANEAIFVAQDGMLRFVNPKSQELLGHSEKELTSRPFVDFIHPLDRDMVLERHYLSLKGERPQEVYPFRVIDILGNIKWVEIDVIAINWEGRPATLNFLVDITEKRKIEEELSRLEKLESLGILAGGIAHDFNNFLTAILGNVALARMHCKSPEKALERLTEAEKACLQAQGLTQQLLTFSKGGAPIKKHVSIARLVEDSCKFALRGSNVAGEFSLPEDLFPVEVDAGQIGQVLNNLVINAAQAMPRGGTIEVSAKNCTVSSENGLPIEEGKYLMLQIKDQGIGIPEDILPRIFDPYFTTKQRGSGLGLATAYSIIKNHGGFITAESQLGTGTTFTIYLPASEAIAEIGEAPKGKIGGSGGRILLMDDSDAIRDLGEEMLSALGYEVFVAPEGAAAVELYSSNMQTSRSIDAVILDLTVPGGMEGLEAMRKLREIDPNVKAIVSSGYSTDPIMANYAQYGFKGVVAKPYSVEELSDVLIQVLAGTTA